jgi:hypothetical protein
LWTKGFKISDFKGPATATMSFSNSIQTQFSTDTDISLEIVSLNIGFHISESYTVSDSYSVKVPKGKTYRIVANPIYSIFQFDVWYSPLIGPDFYEGIGTVMIPFGICFNYFETK